MVDAVQQHEIPQNVANGNRLATEERNRSIEILWPEFLYPRDRIAMNAFEPRAQLDDGFRSLQPWRAGVRRYPSALDSETSVRLDLGEMPGQLAEGPAFRVGTEVISLARQRFEQFDRFRRLVFPDIVEIFELGLH